MWRFLVTTLLLLSFTVGLAAWQDDKPAGGADFVQEELPATPPEKGADNQLKRMIFGNDEALSPNSDQAKKIIQDSVRWYLHRLTWEKVQTMREGSISDIMEAVLGTGSPTYATALFPPLVSRQPAIDADQKKVRQKQQEYTRAVTAEALPVLQQLLKNKQLVVRVNAGRVLERLAELGQTNIADTLVGVLNNPKESNAVRLWAIEALGHLLKDNAGTGKLGETDANGAKYQAAALAIYRWLAAHAALPADQVSQMSGEEQDAISYVRRHAAVALGNTQRPRIVEPGATPADGPIAELLVRIVDNKDVSPPAKMNERVEAAVQLSKLKPRLSPGYQPDYVLYRVANLVSTLGSEAAADAARNKQRWKNFALVLSEAAAELDLNLAEGSPAKVYLGKLKSRNFGVLEFLYDSSRSPQAPQDLFNWLSANPPPSKSVFKD